MIAFRLPLSIFLFIIIASLNLLIYPLYVNADNYPTIYISNLGNKYNTITEALNNIEKGDVVYIHGGIYKEHIVIANKTDISIIGVNQPIIDGDGYGTVITIINCSNILIKGLKIINSGTSYSTEDCGIKIINSRNITIADNYISRVFYGILPKDSENIKIVNNTVMSIPEFYVTDRGHGVYAWYTRNLYVLNNRFEYTQDGSYNDHVINAVIEGNSVRHARYGVHLMYCENIVILRNYITESIAGLVLMYSKNFTARYNYIIFVRGGTVGEGVFIPESDDVVIENNTIIGNIIGFNIRKLPYTPGSKAIIRYNLVAYNYIGIRIDSDSSTTIYGNSFIENTIDVSLIGYSMGGNQWYNDSIKEGNFWSDYKGHDVDGDGIGDTPYTSQDILEDFMDRYSQFKILLYSPSYFILEMMKKSITINPRIKAVDKYPLIKPLHILKLRINFSLESIFISMVLTTLPLFIIFYLRRRV